MPLGILENFCVANTFRVSSRWLPQLLLAIFLVAGLSLAGVAEASEATERVRADIAGSNLEEAALQAANGYIDAAEIADREAEALGKSVEKLSAATVGQPQRIEQLQSALKLDREQALLDWSGRLPADADRARSLHRRSRRR